MMRRLLLPMLFTLAAIALAACGQTFQPLVQAPASGVSVSDLRPISLPADDAPHENLTEWWYFTGHLEAEDGRSYGFEFVIFQSVRGDNQPGYAAHFAITDVDGRTFRYDQRTSLAHDVRRGEGLNLCVGGWTLQRTDAGFAIAAELEGLELNLSLEPRKPPVVHNQTGILDFSPYGWSYYYSYTRLQVRGSLRVDQRPLQVTGRAWMDHQWGDFISVGSGGWDWFSAQLDDGRDFTASVVRGDGGAIVLKYGTLIDREGNARHLAAGEFEIAPIGVWTSPRSGATYPSGWRLRIPFADLELELTPVIPDQELDTRASAGVIYWEGAVAITNAGEPVGKGYVELTGYAAGGFPDFENAGDSGADGACAGPAPAPAT